MKEENSGLDKALNSIVEKKENWKEVFFELKKMRPSELDLEFKQLSFDYTLTNKVNFLHPPS